MNYIFISATSALGLAQLEYGMAVWHTFEKPEKILIEMGDAMTTMFIMMRSEKLVFGSIERQ